jgi:hypothetical protein
VNASVEEKERMEAERLEKQYVEIEQREKERLEAKQTWFSESVKRPRFVAWTSRSSFMDDWGLGQETIDATRVS